MNKKKICFIAQFPPPIHGLSKAVDTLYNSSLKEEFDFEKVSLYDYMEAVHHKPIYFSQNMIVSNANEKISSLLKIKKVVLFFRLRHREQISTITLWNLPSNM